MRLLTTIIEYIFPSYCLNCKSRGMLLCETCCYTFPRSQALPQSFIHALFSYHHNVVKRSLWLLKYTGKKDIALTYGKVIYDYLLESLLEKKLFYKDRKIYCIPIPLTKKRKRKRGYNQSELLITGICAHDTEGVFNPCTNVLQKVRETIPQATIKNRTARLRNMQNVFRVSDTSAIKGTLCILVDDITTTGATLVEARKVLLRAGAKEVLAVVVAH